jgi:hypothetical protein
MRRISTGFGRLWHISITACGSRDIDSALGFESERPQATTAVKNGQAP